MALLIREPQLRNYVSRVSPTYPNKCNWRLTFFALNQKTTLLSFLLQDVPSYGTSWLYLCASTFCDFYIFDIKFSLFSAQIGLGS